MTWQTRRIADLGRIVTGGTPPTSERKYYGSVCPLIKPTDMAIDGFRIGDTEESLSQEGYELFKNRVVPPETTCVVTIGTIGKLCLTKEASVCNQAVNSVVVDRQSYDPYFVFYLLKTCISKVKFLSSGTASGRENVSKSSFESIEVKTPPLLMQERIGNILRNYDELIENDQRRIGNVEAMARTLYREWFVYFLYPGHERVSRIASSLGDIPQGWEVKKLGELINYNRRATKPGPHLDERKYVPIECLPSKNLALIEAKPSEEAQSSLHLFEKGDILFGAMRPYFHKVAIAPFPGVTRTTCFVFKPAKPEWNAFATLTAFEEATVAYANAHSQGATIPYAVWDGSLAEMPIVLPPDALLRRFDRIVAPMLARIAQSFFHLNNLRRTRDLLLPRLLSGQLNLREN